MLGPLPVIFLQSMPKEGSSRLGIFIKNAPEDHNSTFLQLLSHGLLRPPKWEIKIGLR